MSAIYSLLKYLRYRHGVLRNFSRGGKVDIVAYLFQIANDKL